MSKFKKLCLGSVALSVVVVAVLAFSAVSVDITADDGGVNVTDWTRLQSAIDVSVDGTDTRINLSNDVTRESTDSLTITVPAGKIITLDLCGFTLNGYNGSSVLTVKGTLTLVDNSVDGNGKITSKVGNTTNGRGVYIDKGTFNMYGGSITGNDVKSASGGGVYANAGSTFNLFDGIISNNNGKLGGGVYISSATFNMYGGIIENNTTRENGSGVYVSGTFNMSGGLITENVSNASFNGSYSGGVYFDNFGTMTISGDAKIVENKRKVSGVATPIQSNIRLAKDNQLKISADSEGKFRGDISIYNSSAGYKISIIGDPEEVLNTELINGKDCVSNIRSDTGREFYYVDGTSISASNYEAYIKDGDTNTYGHLVDLIDYANTNSSQENPVSIVLLSDILLNSELTVGSGSNINLDLAGFDIMYETGYEGRILTVNGTLLLNDNSEFGGEIRGGNAELAGGIYVTGTLILDGNVTVMLNFDGDSGPANIYLATGGALTIGDEYTGSFRITTQDIPGDENVVITKGGEELLGQVTSDNAAYVLTVITQEGQDYITLRDPTIVGIDHLVIDSDDSLVCYEGDSLRSIITVYVHYSNGDESETQEWTVNDLEDIRLPVGESTHVIKYGEVTESFTVTALKVVPVRLTVEGDDIILYENNAVNLDTLFDGITVTAIYNNGMVRELESTEWTHDAVTELGEYPVAGTYTVTITYGGVATTVDVEVIVGNAYYTLNDDDTVIYGDLWEIWRYANSSSDTVKITMTAEVTSTDDLWVNSNRTIELDLNGFTLYTNSAGYNTLKVFGTFTLRDSSTLGTGSLTSTTSKSSARVDIDGTFNMYSGSITGNVESYYSRGVNVNLGGTFNMYGGSITSNSYAHGGGVYVYYGTFNMSGGSITENSCEYGGGVYVDNGTFNMSGGSITDNTAEYGGGIYADSATINFSGDAKVIDNFDPNGEIRSNVYAEYVDIFFTTDGTGGFTGTVGISDDSTDFDILISLKDGEDVFDVFNAVLKKGEYRVSNVVSDSGSAYYYIDTENALLLVSSHDGYIDLGNDERTYGDLEDLFSQVNTDSGESDTASIHLASDVFITSMLTVDINVNIHLDLNGFSISSATAFTGRMITVNGSLLLIDQVGGSKISGGEANLAGGIYVTGALSLSGNVSVLENFNEAGDPANIWLASGVVMTLTNYTGSFGITTENMPGDSGITIAKGGSDIGGSNSSDNPSYSLISVTRESVDYIVLCDPLTLTPDRLDVVLPDVCYEGDSLRNVIIVNAYYSNGDVGAITEWTVSGENDHTLVSGQQSVTIEYEGIDHTFNITALEVIPTDLVAEGEEISFYAGNAVNIDTLFDDITVTATYNNGMVRELDSTEWTHDAATELGEYPAAGTYTITITYGGATTTVDVEVMASNAYYTLNDSDTVTYGVFSEIWEYANSLDFTVVKITMTADVTFTDHIAVDYERTIELDLNGFTLYTDSDDYNALEVYGTFTLRDSSTPGEGRLTSHISGSNERIYVEEGGTFNMYGGSITGNDGDDSRGVYVDWYGTFNMYGGSITENSYERGGGVYVDRYGTFNMYDGSITENSAENGGGVYVDWDGTFNMYGGSITDNTAGLGGGVYVGGIFNMSGGSITGNNAGYGGGAYVSGGTFNMYGGSITDNTAQYGGGVYIDEGTFNMSDGSITDNTAQYGGGIHADSAVINFSGDATVIGNFDPNGEMRSNVYASDVEISFMTDDNGGFTGKVGISDDSSDFDLTISLEDGEDVSDVFDAVLKKGKYRVSNVVSDSGSTYYYVDTDNALLSVSSYDAYIDLGNGKRTCGDLEDLFSQVNEDSGELEITSIHLMTDVIIESMLTVDINVDIHLDLNGFSISSATAFTGRMITVNGSLLLIDQVGGSNISGGEANFAGGIYVTGSLSLSGDVSVLENINENGDPANIWLASGVMIVLTNYTGSFGIITENAPTTGYIKIAKGGVDLLGSVFSDDLEFEVMVMIENDVSYIVLQKPSNAVLVGINAAITASTCYMDDSIRKVITVYAEYSNGDIGAVIDWTVDGVDDVNISPGEEYTISYNEMSCKITIDNVLYVSVESFDVEGDLKTLYAGNMVNIDTLFDGITITATYNNGTIEELDPTEWTHNAATELGEYPAAGTYTVTITYGGATTTVDVEVMTGNAYYTLNDDDTVTYGVFSEIWEYANSLDDTVVKITMTADVTFTDHIAVDHNRTIELDLNGFTLYVDYIYYNTLEVIGTFTLRDSSTSGEGRLTSHTSDLGERIHVEEGTFNMYGGSIAGNAGDHGRGVYVGWDATFNMYGGSITGNYYERGGGVFVDWYGTFNMYGGSITKNDAGNGGSVYVEWNGTFNMSGGSITGNTAEFDGGVYVRGTFNMSGGSITDNIASRGGGAYVSGGTFNMSGGSITDNTAQYGGGVHISESNFNMYGGSITDNTAQHGGGIYADYAAIDFSGDATVIGNFNSYDEMRSNIYGSSALISFMTDEVGGFTGKVGILDPSHNYDVLISLKDGEDVDDVLGTISKNGEKRVIDVTSDVDSKYYYLEGKNLHISSHDAYIDLEAGRMYDDLASLFEYANNQDEQIRIVLIGDADASSSLVVASKADIILDLAGFDISGGNVADGAIIQVYGKLLLNDAEGGSEIKYGSKYPIGGIYVEGALSLSGDVSVLENTNGNGDPANIGLSSGFMMTLINYTGSFGIITENAPTTGYIKIAKGGVDLLGSVGSDNSDYEVMVMIDNDVSYIVLQKPSNAVLVGINAAITAPTYYVGDSLRKIITVYAEYSNGDIGVVKDWAVYGNVDENIIAGEEYVISYKSMDCKITIDDPIEVSLESLEVEGDVTPLYAGNMVNIDTLFDGITVTATYNNGTIEELDPTEWTHNAATELGEYPAAGTYTITITYGGATTTVDVEVMTGNAYYTLNDDDTVTYGVFSEIWEYANSSSDTVKITMTADVTFTDHIAVDHNRTIELDLNGFTLYTDYEDYNALEVYGTFTLRDSSMLGDGRLTSSISKSNERAHIRGTFNMYGGSITGNDGDDSRGVYVDWNGTFNMYGGSITGNSARDGGGVYVNGIFNMYGGSITENTANSGGGVCVVESGFNIYGGSITGNTANSGGGVSSHDGTFYMSGGSITGNTANSGGGVYLNGEMLYMSGGSITDNTADYGGGVYIMSGFNLYRSTGYQESFNISNDAFVSGNEGTNGDPSNLYFESDIMIIVQDTFTGTLGLTSDRTPTTAEPVVFTLNNVTDDSLSGLVSDDDIFIIGTYNGKAAIVPGLVSIGITKDPINIVYAHGADFKTAGMTVTAYYTDGSSRSVFGYEVVNGNNLALDIEAIEISYTENGITKADSVAITVIPLFEGISITDDPMKMIYKEGEDFDPAGMIVTAIYSDGSSVDVADYIVLNGENLSIGTELKVRYTDKGVTREIGVSITVHGALESITVTTDPDKTVYTRGEDFDQTGMVVTAEYEGGYTVDVTACVVIANDKNLGKGTTELTISYTDGVEVTTTVSITVNDVLVSISVTTGPDKTKYVDGEDFVSTGMVVTATYSDDSSAPVVGYEILDSEDLVLGTTKLIVSYTEGAVTKTTEVSITVLKALVSISITAQPEKTIYAAGENFVSTGMVVTATYSDGSSDLVADYDVIDGEGLVFGVTELTVSYTENGITKDDKVSIMVYGALESITVTTPPNKTMYTQGEDFVSTGMVVTAEYEGGYTVDVTACVVIANDKNLGKGTTELTISYTDGVEVTTTVSIIVNDVLVSISITSQPTQTTYVEGQDFDPAGMVVTATYLDDSSAPVVGYEILDSEDLALGTTELTVSYTEGDVTKTATVSITVTAKPVDDGGLSTTQIAAIAVGVIAAIGVAGFAVWFIRK